MSNPVLILQKRLAKGEITEEEYVRMIGMITSGQSPFSLSLTQKIWLVASFVLTVASILNLFQGVGGFQWSTAFDNFILAYKAVFHWPLDWLTKNLFLLLFGWVDVTIPWWFKDGIVVFGSSFVAFNLWVLYEEGASIWDSIIEEGKGSILKKIGYFLYAFFIMPIIYFFALLSAIRGKDDELIPDAKSFFKIWGAVILFAVIMTGINFTFLKFGL